MYLLRITHGTDVEPFLLGAHIFSSHKLYVGPSFVILRRD